MKFLSVVLTFLLCGQVFGVDGYSISASGSQDLNEHSDCQQVVNNGTLSIFVPTKTNTEWQSFQTNPPYCACVAAATVYTCI